MIELDFEITLKRKEKYIIHFQYIKSRINMFHNFFFINIGIQANLRAP
jgi:hypothetical protein